MGCNITVLPKMSLFYTQNKQHYDVCFYSVNMFTVVTKGDREDKKQTEYVQTVAAF